MNDIRYALRTLLKSPAFAAVAILTLALGIGANTAMFSLVHAVLLRPIPVSAPERLASIFTTDVKNPGNLPMSHLNYLDVREKSPVFSGVAAFTFSQMNYDAGTGTPEPVPVQVVSGNYFDVLGVRMTAGRGFQPQEDQTPGTHAVAVASHGFWQRQFGGRDLVGRTVTLNRQPFTIVGIAPRGFDGVFVFGGPDLWVPMMMHDVAQPGFDWYNERRGLFLFPFGRLQDGVSVEQATAALDTLGRQLAQAFPNENRGRSVKPLPLLQARVDINGEGQLARISMLLMAVVGTVLLIACANLANLLLARAAGRQREMAVRVAIGASRGRIVRQLLAESVTLAALGGLAGIALAYWTLQLLVAGDLPLPLPAVEQARLDPRVLGFAAVVTLATGLVFGLMPALQSARADVVTVLKDATAAVGRGTRGALLRKGLVAAEIALSLVALVAAGLFARSLQHTRAIDPGFETEHVVIGNFNLGREGYTEERGRVFHRQLADRLAAIPGVTSASLAQNAPFAGGISRSVLLEGQDAARGDRVLIQVNRVSERYFETLGIPLVAGRAFTSGDHADAAQVVVINQRMASQLWPGQDPIGKRFRFFGEEAWTSVVGVVRDAKYNGLAEEPIPYVYEPLAQDYVPAASLHVKSAGAAASAIPDVRRAVAEIDRSLSIFQLETLDDRVTDSLDGARANVVLLGVFGLLALALAAIGIYGVTSYTVAQQTREIGIRMALGAGRAGVVALVLRQTLTLVAIGLVVGIGIAMLLALGVRSLLTGTTWLDATTYAATAALLVIVAIAATLVPARRATKVDPLVALRS
jgi:predicted permease